MQNLIKKIGKKRFPRWSEQTSGGNFTTRIRTIRELLSTIAGGELNEMLDDILSLEMKERINFKYTCALSRIGLLFVNKIEKNFKPFVRRKIIKALNESGISFSLV